jgi:hypothetical protein
MKEALSSSETSVLTRTTRRNIPEGTLLQSAWATLIKTMIQPGGFSYTLVTVCDTTRCHSSEDSNANCHCSEPSNARKWKCCLGLKTAPYSDTHTWRHAPATLYLAYGWKLLQQNLHFKQNKNKKWITTSFVRNRYTLQYLFMNTVPQAANNINNNVACCINSLRRKSGVT